MYSEMLSPHAADNNPGAAVAAAAAAAAPGSKGDAAKAPEGSPWYRICKEVNAKYAAGGGSRTLVPGSGSGGVSRLCVSNEL